MKACEKTPNEAGRPAKRGSMEDSLNSEISCYDGGVWNTLHNK